MIPRRLVPLAVAALLPLAAGCRQSPTQKAPAKPAPARRPEPPPRTPPPDRAYDPGTQRMRAEADRLIATIPGASEATRLEIARKLMALGEPATPALMEALHNPDPDTRSLSAFILGFRNDRRTIPELRQATQDPVTYVALEAAAALLKCGDEAGLPRLVDGLEDPDPRLRARSLVVLEEWTHRTMDFHADGSPEDRAAAVARWRAWLASRGAGAR
jgi:HEAT repeat protein